MLGGAVVLTLTVLALPATADVVRQDGGDGYVPTLRFAGESRVDTAALVTEETAPDAPTVLLANAGDFPDALAGSALGVPILLTGGTDLDPVTAAALEARGATTVLVLGGASAIAPDVVAALDEGGHTSFRLAGADRFATAATVARFSAGSGAGDGTTAIVANGRSFPDALAAAPLAAGEGLPLLLTEADDLPDPTAAALTDLGVDRVVVPGGEAVVTPDVVDQLEDLGIEVVRVAGSDRTTTAAALSDFAADEYGWPRDVVTLARGDAFPDALAIGPRAGALRAPLLLTGATDLPPATAEHLIGLGEDTVGRLEIAGGEVSVSAETLQAARAALAGEVPEDPAPPPPSEDPGDPAPGAPAVADIDIDRITETPRPGAVIDLLFTAVDADGQPLPGATVTIEAYRGPQTADDAGEYTRVFGETRAVDANGQTAAGVALATGETIFWLACPTPEAAPDAPGSCVADGGETFVYADGAGQNFNPDVSGVSTLRLKFVPN